MCIQDIQWKYLFITKAIHPFFIVYSWTCFGNANLFNQFAAQRDVSSTEDISHVPWDSEVILLPCFRYLCRRSQNRDTVFIPLLDNIHNMWGCMTLHTSISFLLSARKLLFLASEENASVSFPKKKVNVWNAFSFNCFVQAYIGLHKYSLPLWTFPHFCSFTTWKRKGLNLDYRSWIYTNCANNIEVGRKIFFFF